MANGQNTALFGSIVGTLAGVFGGHPQQQVTTTAAPPAADPSFASPRPSIDPKVIVFGAVALVFLLIAVKK